MRFFSSLPCSGERLRNSEILGVDASSSANLQIGWGLGSYRFDRYRKPVPPRARLVLPDTVDGAEISLIAESAMLARDPSLLSTATGRIAEGDLASPVPVSGRSEVADLATAVRAMQDELRELVGQVRQASDTIRMSSQEVAAGEAAVVDALVQRQQISPASARQHALDKTLFPG